MLDLSVEITEEILARIPAKSLVRFNLVCKRWRSLISDPNFVRKHLNHVLSDTTNNHRRLIVSSSPDFYSIDFQSLKSTKRDFPFQSPHGLRILGSCNGLLLGGLYNQDYRCTALVLWNPSLRDYKLLPDCSLNSTTGFVRLLGFGYDSSINDYKVVRVITDSGHGEPLLELEQKVEIYTLKTNSWRRIQGIPCDDVTIGHRVEGTLVNGSIYWVVSDYQYDDYEFGDLVIAFDLIDEKFRLIRAPRDIDMQSMWGRSLVEVRGCLGLYQTLYWSPYVEIWKLNEDKKSYEYWSKLMKIPKNGFCMYTPAFFSKNNEVLLSITSNMPCKEYKKLVVYNSENVTFQDLPTCGTSVWSEEMIYVETLVSPNGIGG